MTHDEEFELTSAPKRNLDQFLRLKLNQPDLTPVYKTYRFYNDRGPGVELILLYLLILFLPLLD